MQHTQATCSFTPEDMFLQQSSISFDMTLAEIWLPLSVGASILPAEARAQQDGPRLLRQISRHPVTVVCPVPSELFMWLESGLTHTRASRVRWLMTGAEALSPALLSRTQAALPGIRTLNMYGPTEVGHESYLIQSHLILSAILLYYMCHVKLLILQKMLVQTFLSCIHAEVPVNPQDAGSCRSCFQNLSFACRLSDMWALSLPACMLLSSETAVMKHQPIGLLLNHKTHVHTCSCMNVALHPSPFVLIDCDPMQATMFVASSVLEGPQPADKQISVGQPIANAKLFILDSAMQPVPFGETSSAGTLKATASSVIIATAYSGWTAACQSVDAAQMMLAHTMTRPSCHADSII